MLDKVKVIAIIVVLLAAGTVGVALYMGNDKGPTAYNIDAGLKVYGNADGNYTIDSKDKTIIQDIMDGKLSLKDHPFADANYDGKITKDDLKLVDKIIKKENCTIYNVNTCNTGDYVVDTKWPVKSALSTGSSNMLLLLTMGGADDKIHGISYSAKSPPDSTLFPTFSKMKSLGSSTTKMPIDAATDTIKNYKVTTLISDKTASTIDKKTVEPQYEAMGVDVVRVAPAVVDSDEFCSQLLLIGFLFDTQTKSLEIAEWQTKMMKDISGKLEGVKKVKVVTSNGPNWISAKNSDYKDVVVAAGGEYAIPDDAVLEGKYTSGAYFNQGDTWLYNYDFDYLISIRTLDWYSGTVDVAEKYNQSMANFVKTKAYENGKAFVMVGDGPIPTRVAYAASILYPDIFTKEWADNMNQEFFDRYYNIKVDLKDKFFVISPSMVPV